MAESSRCLALGASLENPSHGCLQALQLARAAPGREVVHRGAYSIFHHSDSAPFDSACTPQASSVSALVVIPAWARRQVQGQSEHQEDFANDPSRRSLQSRHSLYHLPFV